MKLKGIAAIATVITVSLFASSQVYEEEMICDIPYEASYAKCNLEEKKEPYLTVKEKEKKLLKLTHYKAKGKINIDPKKRKLQLWIGRNY